MALIECKGCGKKISDTSDVCIHCGTPTAAEEVSQEEVVEAKKELDFYDFCGDDKLRLESEFVASDTWGRRYRRQKEEAPLFRRLIIYPCLIYAGLAFAFRMGFLNSGSDEISARDEKILIALLIASSVFFAVTFLYGVFLSIRLKATQARFVYLKKFQVWLLREKNIRYTPLFLKIKEQEIFECITIDD